MRTSHRASIVAAYALGMIACKEPMADDPGYKAQVACTQKMKGRASSGKGTRNDSKALCIGALGDKYRADPKANIDALADCILDAPDEATAKTCK